MVTKSSSNTPINKTAADPCRGNTHSVPICPDLVVIYIKYETSECIQYIHTNQGHTTDHYIRRTPAEWAETRLKKPTHLNKSVQARTEPLLRLQMDTHSYTVKHTITYTLGTSVQFCPFLNYVSSYGGEGEKNAWHLSSTVAQGKGLLPVHSRHFVNREKEKRKGK